RLGDVYKRQLERPGGSGGVGRDRRRSLYGPLKTLDGSLES
ncbi:hypothetical protein ACV36C_37070, partial [Pseudomonas aeruginosa]